MLYDAILNGARSIAFYGGNNPNCWTASDSQYGWNWSFWSSVLKPLLGEINSLSPLAPALVNPATTQTLPANDATTQAISRQGNSGDLWVIAARRGAGTAHVTIGGLPAAVSTGTVYTEGRSIAVSNGSFTDDFSQWGVHVYHFVPDAPPPPPPRDATAVLRRRRRWPRSRHVLGRACRERQGRRPSRPHAHRGEQGRSRAGCRRNGVAVGERHDLGIDGGSRPGLRCRPSLRLRPRLPRSTRHGSACSHGDRPGAGR